MPKHPVATLPNVSWTLTLLLVGALLVELRATSPPLFGEGPTAGAAQQQSEGATEGRLRLEGGYVETGMNEVSIVSSVDDPPGLRLGVMREEAWGRSLGKFSFNSVRSDGVQDECVLIQGKLDERFPTADLVGEYSFFLRTPPGGGDEGDMVRVMTLQHDRIVAHVPLVFEHEGRPVPEPEEQP